MDTKILREQLLKLLEGANAHITFQGAIKDFPIESINARVPGIPYSAWELIEHMRMAQYDILDFIINPDYKEMKWPEEYWPQKGMVATTGHWNKTIAEFEKDMASLKEIVGDSQTDFTGGIPHAPGYTILREVLLVADHNSYHTGQIIAIRRALNIY